MCILLKKDELETIFTAFEITLEFMEETTIKTSFHTLIISLDDMYKLLLFWKKTLLNYKKTYLALGVTEELFNERYQSRIDELIVRFDYKLDNLQGKITYVYNSRN